MFSVPSVKSSGSLHSVCGSTNSDMSTAASSLPDTSFSDISFPSAAKSLSKTAPDTSQSSSSSKVKKEASFVNGNTGGLRVYILLRYLILRFTVIITWLSASVVLIFLSRLRCELFAVTFQGK